MTDVLGARAHPAGAPTVVDLVAPFPGRPLARRAKYIGVWAGGWTALVVVMASVVSVQKYVPFVYSLRSEAVNYYSLAAVSIVLWQASARISARSWSVGRQAVAHVALGVLLTACWQGVYGMYMWSVMGSQVWERLYRGTWMFQATNAFVLYSAVLAGTLAWQSARRAHAQERRQHELLLAAREAELRALNAQLEPHFLLNTLNSVLALVDNRPADARLMLERLSELLKATFDEMEEPTVPLGRELDLMAAYLGIEQIRFADRLRVTIDVPEALRDVPVPPFFVQPIVENAIKHAVAPNRGAAFIAITARASDGRLRIAVADSGRGFDYASAARRGHGLQLAERRLAAHAPDATIDVERTAAGFAVVLTLPL
jgi:histidine kinase/histidine kinase/DNA gyrase B/HSP90-like ATPase